MARHFILGARSNHQMEKLMASRIKLALPVILCLASQAGAVIAQSANEIDLPPEASNPAVIAAWFACKEDIKAYCPDVRPGGGRIIACLVENKLKLSRPCIVGMMDAKAALSR
jgi:Cysteine rich repeat